MLMVSSYVRKEGYSKGIELDRRAELPNWGKNGQHQTARHNLPLTEVGGNLRKIWEEQLGNTYYKPKTLYLGKDLFAGWQWKTDCRTSSLMEKASCVIPNVAPMAITMKASNSWYLNIEFSSAASVWDASLRKWQKSNGNWEQAK